MKKDYDDFDIEFDEDIRRKKKILIVVLLFIVLATGFVVSAVIKNQHETEIERELVENVQSSDTRVEATSEVVSEVGEEVTEEIESRTDSSTEETNLNYLGVLEGYHSENTDKFKEGTFVFSVDERYDVSTKDADGETCLSIDQYYFGRGKLTNEHSINFQDLEILKIEHGGNLVYTADNGGDKYIVAFKGEDNIKLLPDDYNSTTWSCLVYDCNIEFVEYGEYKIIFCTVTA